MWTHILVLALVMGQAVESARVGKLVAQLGSSKFKDRDLATQELNALGASALEALRQAAKAPDPEIRRRADMLLKQIQHRLEAARLLEPKRLHLVYQNSPLREAVADLAVKTGLTVHLGDTEGNRRITLDTGNTTLWEAFDQFCQGAGLVERATQASAGGQEVRIMNVRGGVGQAQMVIVDRSSSISGANGLDESITLMAGKPRMFPTCYAGALRVRALPAAGKALGQSNNETLLLLEISPQPKLSWQNTLEVRIDTATDEEGQRLFPAPTSGTSNADVLARRVGNGVVIVDADGRVMTGAKEVPVRLQRGDKTSHVLKEVKGALTGQIKAPEEAILTVDNILNATGKMFQGTDGTQAKIVDVSRKGDDQFRVKLRMEGSPDLANLGGASRRGLPRRRFQTRVAGNSGDAQLALQDAEGRDFLVAEMEANWMTGNNGAILEIETTYSQRAGQGDPVKLVYKNRRTVTVEVPFTLKNVPLP